MYTYIPYDPFPYNLQQALYENSNATGNFEGMYNQNCYITLSQQVKNKAAEIKVKLMLLRQARFHTSGSE